MFLRAVLDCVLSREFCESISTGSAQTLYPLLRTLLPDLDVHSNFLPPTRRDMGVLVEILQRTFISRDSRYSLSSVNFV